MRFTEHELTAAHEVEAGPVQVGERVDVIRPILLTGEEEAVSGMAAIGIARFDDSALLLAFAGSAQAMFPAPTAIEREVTHYTGARVIGRSGIVESGQARIGCIEDRARVVAGVGLLAPTCC